jgi:hypothetical protein
MISMGTWSFWLTTCRGTAKKSLEVVLTLFWQISKVLKSEPIKMKKNRR